MVCRGGALLDFFFFDEGKAYFTENDNANEMLSELTPAKGSMNPQYERRKCITRDVSRVRFDNIYRFS